MFFLHMVPHARIKTFLTIVLGVYRKAFSLVPLEHDVFTQSLEIISAGISTWEATQSLRAALHIFLKSGCGVICVILMIRFFYLKISVKFLLDL